MGAGIGSGYSGTTGDIEIVAGTITATGGFDGSGIGTGYSGTTGDITIDAGTITATGGAYGSGIGTGYHGTVRDITIYDGTISATSENYGAAIGGGYSGTVRDITINNGTISATSEGYGSAIGGGYSGTVRDITINNGTISATSGYFGSGIGTGDYGHNRNITIAGGAVSATGNYFGSGIGAGYFGTYATLLISGGKVDAGAIANGAAISGGNIHNGGITTLSGGVITLTAGVSTIGDSLDGYGGIAYLNGESIDGTALVSSEENDSRAAEVAFIEQANSGVDIYQETMTTEPLVTRYTFRNAITFVTPLLDLSSQSIDWGGYAARPRVSSIAGYTITGWHVGASDGPLFDFTSTPITNPVSLVPSLAPKTYSITYELALGTGSSEAGDATFATGTTFALPGAPTRTGYTFTGWSVAGTHAEVSALAATATTSAVAGWGDITVTAQWRINKYKVMFNSLGGTRIAPKQANYNSTIKKPKTPKKAGYTFKSWRVGSARGPAFNFATPITANITIYALWQKKK
jgi:uncharacterized repeat protein (TIGR02543 family)